MSERMTAGTPNNEQQHHSLQLKQGLEISSAFISPNMKLSDNLQFRDSPSKQQQQLHSRPQTTCLPSAPAPISTNMKLSDNLQSQATVSQQQSALHATCIPPSPAQISSERRLSDDLLSPASPPLSQFQRRTASQFLDFLMQKDQPPNESINNFPFIDHFLSGMRNEDQFALIPIRHKMEYLFCRLGEGEKKLKEMIAELFIGVARSELSQIQFEILLEKLDGMTFKKLKKIYGISSDSVISRVIKRTACGRFWDRSVMKGGRDSILSDLDVHEFVRIVKERENDINCLSTCEARKIVLHLQTQRVLKAQVLLMKCGCNTLVNKVHVKDPDPTWLQKMARKHGLLIVPSSELETMRRIACDQTAIEEFFMKHSHLLQRDPKLIFNMDETMVN